MTDQPPQPPQPQAGPPAGPPPGQYPGVPPTPAADPYTTGTAVAAEPARGSRKGLVIGGSIAAGILVLGAAGAGAYALLDGGGAQPEEALPASTIGYVRIDLDPSAQQKINLLRLADRLPNLSDDLGVEISEDSDLKQLLAESVTASGECEIDYEADVAPWIGERAAIAAVPGDDDATHAVGVLAVTDESAARTAIESGLGCGETTDSAQIAFTSGYAVITDDVPAADIVAAAEESSLADNEMFTADMEALGDAGLVSVWADAEGFAEWSSDNAELFGGEALTESDLANMEGYTSMTGALRANPDGIELTFLSNADEAALAPYQSTGTSVTAALPETTLAAFSASTTPDAVDEMWEQLHELYDSMGSALGGGTLMSSTGSSIPAPTSVLGTDVDPDLYDYCLEAAEDLGFAGDDLSADDQMMLDVFMDSCAGAATDEPTATDELTTTDDEWTTTTEDPWDQGYGQPSFDGMVALLDEEFDIRLPEDLKTLFGEQLVIALDAQGLDDVDAIQGVEDVSAGVRTIGDTDALEDLAGRLDHLLVESGQGALSTSPADDGFVFATNDTYASDLAADGGLGSTDVYRSVVADEEASSVLFVDLDRLTEVLRPAFEESGDDLTYLEPLRAAAMTIGADDEHATVSLRVSFD
ncbi:DUF3352 domain-containing protein [Isoptericola croceus]|uniref:DUF3352 domain-containing protein n=1 Tax=Isoptericola croceus TaxID=3031406 RepID=UPI0023F86291|nr:hypothetical protein [Isoptericola croceus]